MASAFKHIEELVEDTQANSDLCDVLKERDIFVFSQHIELSKESRCGTRLVKVNLDITDCRKKFTIYLDNEKYPLMAINGLNQFEEACDQIRDRVDPDEIRFIRFLLEELDAKKVKFQVPHSYYFAVGENAYLIDTSTTKERAVKIKTFLKSKPKSYHILSSHYHPDHWANNVLLAARNTRIYVHHADKKIFRHGYWILMYMYMKKFFQLTDVTDAIRRNLSLSRKMLGFVDLLIRKAPVFAVLAFQMYNMKFVERFRSGKRHFYYLYPESEQFFILSELNISGWTIVDDGLIALETPGHSYDHLAFYIKDRKTLFSGEIDVFLNPVSMLDCPPPLIHSTIDKIIQFIQNEKIELLLPSHYLPISGNQKIIKHLTEQKDKLKQCYESICRIVLEKERWEWKKLMQAIYESSEEIIQEAVRVNWPKTISNLDIYVIFILKELGYKLVDSSTKTWEVCK